MENVTRRTVQTGRKRFATLRANILQIPMSTANGLGLKVSETLHLKIHRICMVKIHGKCQTIALHHDFELATYDFAGAIQS